MADVLLIDPGRKYRDSLVPVVTAAGHVCRVVSDSGEARASTRRKPCDVVLLDVDPPGPEGLASLPGMTAMGGQPEVLALTAEGAGSVVEDAIRAGAWDVLLHPFAEPALRQALERCLYHHAAKVALVGQAAIRRGAIIGDSPQLDRCLHSLAVAARTDTNVLILGETGTGKELFARAVHENSERAGRGFIVVDCTNLPTTLAESILFGHERGSFTGADAARDGLFKQADGGTIFLDEIGDLDLAVQKSLLRVLQERTFRPLSARSEVRSDFRLVSATNCDIEEMVRRGAFRKDLYHRLKTRTIHLPALRERRDDIEPLARHYVERICKQHRLAPKQMAVDFAEALRLYNWPGNVRDLINALHFAVQAAFAEQRLYPQHLPVEIRGHIMRALRDEPAGSGAAEEIHVPAPRDEAGGGNGAGAMPSAALRGQQGAGCESYAFASEAFPSFRSAREVTMDRMESAYLMELIRRSRGDIASAISLSGLSRARLYELLQKHSISLRNSN